MNASPTLSALPTAPLAALVHFAVALGQTLHDLLAGRLQAGRLHRDLTAALIGRLDRLVRTLARLVAGTAPAPAVAPRARAEGPRFHARPLWRMTLEEAGVPGADAFRRGLEMVLLEHRELADLAEADPRVGKVLGALCRMCGVKPRRFAYPRLPPLPEAWPEAEAEPMPAWPWLTEAAAPDSSETA